VCWQKKINIFMSTHNLRRYLDLLNEADLVPPNTEVALPSLGTFNNDQAVAAALAQENRCVKCGTPQAQHTGLKHAFVAEPGASGGGGIARIKQLQQELKAAGAPLGATGAARDGIDGALGPLTRAAAAKNPIIAAKYSDVLGTETATPAASQATISQLTTALDTIEKILAKYKVKMSESRFARKSGNENQMATWRDLMEADPAAQRRSYQDAIQRNIPADPAEAPGFAQSKIQKGGYVAPAPTASPNPYVTRPGGSREAQAYQAEKAAQAAGAATGPAQAMPYTQAAGKAGTMGKLWSGIKGIASKAALPITALYSIWDGYEQISALPADMPKDQYRAAVTKIVARLVNDFGLFWVGAILGAAAAGAISGPGALVGFVAGGAGGIAASYLLGDSVGAITDAIVDQMYGLGPKINISSEDAAVLDQNLKDIQSMSKDPAIAAAITPDLRSRIERVIKSAAAAIAADTPAAGGQSATPTGKPAGAASAPDDLVKSIDGIEKILTKYKFEDIESVNDANIMTERELRSFVLKNMHLLTESEQMAVRRDIMTEGPIASWAVKKLAPKFKAGWDAAQAQADAAKAAAQTAAAAKAATPTGTLAGSAGSAAKKAWDTTKSVADTAFKATLATTAAAATFTGVQLYGMLKGASDSADELMSDDNSYLSDADKAELGQHAAVLEKYLKTPEDAAKLPPEIQQRLAAINTRMKKLVAAGADR
jgi:hypothetical protein